MTSHPRLRLDAGSGRGNTRVQREGRDVCQAALRLRSPWARMMSAYRCPLPFTVRRWVS